MCTFTENIYWELDFFFKGGKKNIFSSTIAEAWCIDMQIYYIIQSRHGEITH